MKVFNIMEYYIVGSKKARLREVQFMPSEESGQYDSHGYSYKYVRDMELELDGGSMGLDNGNEGTS